MAPSRKRGAGKSSAAAAAAAARRQWKVGDLVLAKVKGFPAWPATVSEPEKWGYSHDWKKVLVYFFGTKQIAFCNPADVEAFTEEKKKTLLGKRHGKGADFVRAVQEIIDCYEKSRKQDQDDEANSVNEGTVSNAGNLEDAMEKSAEEGHLKMDVELPYSRFESACVSADQSESHSLVDVFSTAVSDGQRVFEQQIDNVSSLDLLREATLIAGECLRQGSKEAHVQNCLLRRIGPVKRSRTALRADSISSSQLNGSGNVGCNGFSMVSLDESTYNRKSSKPLGRSNYFTVESSSCSPVFISNGSSEDNVSEEEGANSDSINLTEGSTLESCCKTERADLSAEYCDRGVLLSEDPHVGVKSVVLKKRRKQKRKQLAHDTPTVGGPGKDHALEVADNKTRTNLPNNCEVLHEQTFKVNGDEHLPLVKRARVRMGKLQMEENDLNNLKQKEGNSLNEAFVSHSESDVLACGLINNSLTESTSLNVGVTDGSALPNCSNGSFESEHKFWKTKKHQIHRCSADGEAALPPSKRLHRALEAMSANTAEDGRKHMSVQDKELLSSNGHTSSSDQNSSHTAIEQNSSHSTIEQNSSHSTIEQDSSQMVMNEERGNDFIQVVNSTPVEDGHVDEVCGSGSFNCVMSPIKVSLDAKQCNQVVHSLSSPKHSVFKLDFVDQNNDSLLDALNEKTEIDADSSILSSSHEMQGGPEFCSDPANPSSPSTEENGFPNGSLKDEHGHVPVGTIFMERKNSISSPILSDPVAESKERKMAPLNDVIEGLPPPSGCSFNTAAAELPQLDEKVDGMCGSIKEIQPESAWKDMASDLCAPSNENLIAATQAERDLSSSCDLADNLLAIKVSVLSPSISGGMKCNEKISILTATDPSDDSGNCVGDRSETVDASLHQVHENGNGNIESFVSRKQNPNVQCSDTEANAVKKNFESMLGSLSRTKESIGRATRLALDCARHGIAGEVVEILARYLESEPSLHRRVDLFFLVDSITQCSRSQKVESGEVFCSAVQTVLSRLLTAAAPPGSAARENRRQCLKVLRLWLERKTLPESVILHHIRELDSMSDASFSSAYSRRPSRTERPLNDPIREMEGMLVDEYGSNDSIQLSGFFMARRLRDEEGSDADEKGFEAVTPEREPIKPEEQEMSTAPNERHRLILEDVDGELEMEDVAPKCEVEMNSACSRVDTANPSKTDMKESHYLHSGPPLPQSCPPSPPPLPMSPPPMALPPSPVAASLPCAGSAHSVPYMGTNQHFPNHLQQTRPQQPGMSSANSGTSEAHYTSGYRDFTRQSQRPFAPSSSGSCSRYSSPHPFMHNVNNFQEMDHGPFHGKGYRLPPPRSTPSNQFSYVQAGQTTQSWMDSSTSFDKRSQFRPGMHGENLYNNRKMELAPHDVGERFRERPIHSGCVQSNNPEAYASVPPCGQPQESSRMATRGWSPHPRMQSYRRPPPPRMLEGTVPGTNQAPSYWRPR